ncbi:MAG: DUF4149 domain-containing protein [Thermovibrio sp.]|nr:MAG: DUF4149 domain-containing protein [Thermovibrio sp.]
MIFLLKSIYLYSISLWVGALFFFTAVGAPLAFRILSKEEAGKYTGAVFPKYFSLGYIFGILALLSFYLLVRGNLGVVSSVNLLILILMNLFNFINGLLIVPKAGILKAEFYMTKEKSLYDRFLKLHAVSMALNGINVILGLMSVGLTSLYLTF